MREFRLYLKAMRHSNSLNEKALYSVLLMIFIIIIFNNLVLSGFQSGTIVGPSFVLIGALFIVGNINAESLNQPNVLIHFPITARKRVLYYYFHVLYVFIIAYLIFIALIYGVILIFWLISASGGPVEILPGTNDGVVLHAAGDIYSLAVSFIQVALYAGIAFIGSMKKRFLYVGITTLIVALLHVSFLSIISGKLGIYDAYAVMESGGSDLVAASIWLGVSVMLIIGSVRVFQNRMRYPA